MLLFLDTNNLPLSVELLQKTSFAEISPLLNLTHWAPAWNPTCAPVIRCRQYILNSQKWISTARVLDIVRFLQVHDVHEAVAVVGQSDPAGEQDQIQGAVLVLVGELDRRLTLARRRVIVALDVAVSMQRIIDWCQRPLLWKYEHHGQTIARWWLTEIFLKKEVSRLSWDWLIFVRIKWLKYYCNKTRHYYVILNRN